MFDKEAIEFLMSFRDTEIIEHNGIKYSPRSLRKVPEVHPEAFSTKTLASLVELILAEADHPRLDDLVVHVESPTTVHVFSVLRNDFERFHLYTASAELPRVQLGSFLELEEMLIMLKSTFVQSETRDKLISLLGNIKEESVKTSSDDGISQTVTAKVGIASLGNVTLPPVVPLAPYRTFVEVEQPEGEFLLRLRNGPVVALFEADGGAWELQARTSIKKFFEEQLADLIGDGRLAVTE